MISLTRHTFKRDERGSAMTEFVIFLPVFVVTFAGIVNLGKFGYETTRTQVLAQKQLWSKVIPVTYSLADGTQHMSSVVAGGMAAGHLAGLAGDGDNPQQVADGIEAGIMSGGLALSGHWGESYTRVKPFQVVGFANDVDPKFSAEDVIGDQPYPHSLLNDGPNRPKPDGIVGLITAVLAGSGAVPAMAAGIRYGEVFGEENRSFSVGTLGNFSAEAHYDVLVAPSPLKGAATKMTFGFAWAFAQAEDNYRVMMNFGESEWEGDSSGGSSRVDGYLDNADNTLDEGQDEVEEAEEQLEDQREAEEDQREEND